MTLSISIYSFGYHFSGIPEDSTGNGGGFVFDCRCLPNPGRDPKYAKLTGRDKPVQDYLKSFNETNEFFENCYSLVKQAIKNYKKRSFSNLMISFGCTGGQHRSVYFSELLNKRLSKEPDIIVSLKHIELE